MLLLCYNTSMKDQKDLLNDLIDALDNDEQESETDTSELDGSQVVGEDGEIIELDY